MAQDGSPRPDELWTFETDGGASVNDVALDADGKVAAAVQADGSSLSGDDDEVYAWDMDRSKTSSTPAMRDDPSTGFGAPEGMGVVAIEPNPGGKGDFIAVGDEGSSSSNENNVYVYRRSSGGGSESPATYGDDDPPSGAVEAMWFLDRSTLLVQHEDALSLLGRERGTEYEESDAGRWTPQEDAEILDVDVSQTTDRIAIVTADGSGTGDVTLRLHLLEEDDGALSALADPWTTTQSSSEGYVALSQNGRYLLVGTSGNTIYFTGVHDNTNDTADAPEKSFSEFPWSRNGPGGVTAVEIAPRGDWLAAGFDSGELVVYQRTNRTDDGPRAERMVDGAIGTGASPSQVTFADGNRSLLVQAAGLMAFDHRQFQLSDDVRPLWTLSRAESFAVSEDGQRLVVGASDGGDGIVQAFERSYAATISAEAPSSVQPGRTFNVSATIENRGSAFDSYRLSVEDIDSSWNVEQPAQPLELLPGETGNTTVSLTPSSMQAPGDVSFTVRAISQSSPGGEAVASSEASVTVQEVHGAVLDVDTSERSIQQGGTIEIQPQIANQGNTREPIEIRVRQDASWAIAIDGTETDRASYTLDPGETTNATVEISAPGDAPRGTRNTLDLVAHPEDGGTQSSASLSVVVEPSYGAAFEVPGEAVEVEPGQTVDTEVTVLNDGNTEDTFTLDVISNASNPEHLWRAELSPQKVTLEGDGEETFTVSVDVPRGALETESATITLQATSSATGDRVGEASYELTVPEETEDSPTSAVIALAAIGLAALAVRRRTR